MRSLGALKAGTELQGRQVETQSVIIEDGSGNIRLQLCESQVGMVLFGKTYTFSNLSTREFSCELFVTTTRQTSIEQVRSLPGLGAIVPCEDPGISVCSEIIRAEVAVSRTRYRTKLRLRLRNARLNLPCLCVQYVKRGRLQQEEMVYAADAVCGDQCA